MAKNYTFKYEKENMFKDEANNLIMSKFYIVMMQRNQPWHLNPKHGG